MNHMKTQAILEQFGYTDEHDLLRTAARKLLTEECPFSKVRSLSESRDAFDSVLWEAISRAGWPGLPIRDIHGGAELDMLALALLAEETGRALLPSPLSATLLAAIAVASMGNDEQQALYGPRIASGKLIATTALCEPDNSWEANSTQATAIRTDTGYQLSGIKTYVPWAQAARLAVAPFRNGDAISVFAIELPCDGVTIREESTVDRTKRSARVRFDGAQVPKSARLAQGDLSRLQALFAHAQVIIAAEAVGAAQAILSRTRDYAIERIQFDRPIGTFQAVKHPIVNTMIAIEGARSHVYAAAAAIDSGSEAAVPARMAKATATEALTLAADRGVQLHGGYGFTWDCDAHLFFKRSIWCNATLGDAIHHRSHLATALLGAPTQT